MVITLWMGAWSARLLAHWKWTLKVLIKQKEKLSLPYTSNSIAPFSRDFKTSAHFNSHLPARDVWQREHMSPRLPQTYKQPSWSTHSLGAPGLSESCNEEQNRKGMRDGDTS